MVTSLVSGLAPFLHNKFNKRRFSTNLQLFEIIQNSFQARMPILVPRKILQSSDWHLRWVFVVIFVAARNLNNLSPASRCLKQLSLMLGAFSRRIRTYRKSYGRRGLTTQIINSLLTKSTNQLKGLKIFTTWSKNFSPTTKTIPFSITYRFFTFSSVPFSHETFSAVCKIFSDGCVTLRVEGEAKIVGKFGREQKLFERKILERTENETQQPVAAKWTLA